MRGVLRLRGRAFQILLLHRGAALVLAHVYETRIVVVKREFKMIAGTKIV